MWWTALATGIASLAAILYWLWTGTAVIPEKPEKDIGRGVTLPIYVSGPSSVGWWAMFITMTGDATAFASLVFGYFFYWTIHAEFVQQGTGPGVAWPMAALALSLLAWIATVTARKVNSAGSTSGLRAALIAGCVLSILGGVAGLLGPWSYAMDPTAHVYPATVWLLAIWTVIHVAIGLIMQLYCLAGSYAGRLTPVHDIDIHNVALYWHFTAATALVAYGVIAFFPLVA